MRFRFPASARLVVSLGLGVLAVGWAIDHYVSHVQGRVDTGEPSQDLGVFLRAASAVLHRHSPYAFRADQTYAYPPLLAFMATPLHSLGVGAVMTTSILVSLAAIAAALWLLGVRDWRCYCLVPLYPATRSAVDLGTVGPLLLLAVAIAWRWRNRVLAPALAVAVAVALKLFLWPLLVWLAITRRSRAAIAAIGVGIVLVFLPWAAIGFKGLAGYPSLLHRLADQEAWASYSVYAIGVRLHLPGAAATTISLVVSGVLLVAAALIARDDTRAPRDRDVATLALALAAAFALSPIVWVHYFLLLLVPIALVRPRFSLLWVVPFAYYPLGETAWPGGDPPKLMLALVTTVVLLAAALPRDWLERLPAVRVRARSAPLKELKH